VSKHSNDQYEGVAKPAFVAGFNAASVPAAQWRLPNASKLGEAEQIESSSGKSMFSKLGAAMSEAVGGSSFKLHGAQDISTRCKSLSEMACKLKVGCKWHSTKGGECQDSSMWQCASRKKIIDCLAIRSLSPSSVRAPFDTLCGKQLFNQEKQSWTGCTGGIRTGEMCDSDKDCPKYSSDWTQNLPNPKCVTHQTVLGCQDASQRECNEYGFENYVAMVV